MVWDKIEREIAHDRQVEAMRKQLLIDMSAKDPVDQRLRSMIADYKKPRLADGMAGGLMMFAEYNNPAWYKMKAAEKMLYLRHMRRWHRVYNGRDMAKDAIARMLADVSHCRRRAAGLKPMPAMLVIGL